MFGHVTFSKIKVMCQNNMTLEVEGSSVAHLYCYGKLNIYSIYCLVCCWTGVISVFVEFTYIFKRCFCKKKKKEKCVL